MKDKDKEIEIVDNDSVNAESKNIKKNKKIKVIGLAILIIGVISFTVSSKMNDIRNKEVGLSVELFAVINAILPNKDIIVDLQYNMNNLNKDESSFIEIDKILKVVTEDSYLVNNKNNDYIKDLDQINLQIDNMIEQYNNNIKEMQENVDIVSGMEELQLINNTIDDSMKMHNEISAPEFNKMISTFPGSIVAMLNGWEKMDNFQSVK